MFVQSLSWQNDRFSVKSGNKDAVFAINTVEPDDRPRPCGVSRRDENWRRRRRAAAGQRCLARADGAIAEAASGWRDGPASSTTTRAIYSHNELVVACAILLIQLDVQIEAMVWIWCSACRHEVGPSDIRLCRRHTRAVYQHRDPDRRQRGGVVGHLASRGAVSRLVSAVHRPADECAVAGSALRGLVHAAAHPVPDGAPKSQLLIPDVAGLEVDGVARSEREVCEASERPPGLGYGARPFVVPAIRNVEAAFICRCSASWSGGGGGGGSAGSSRRGSSRRNRRRIGAALGRPSLGTSCAYARHEQQQPQRQRQQQWCGLALAAHAAAVSTRLRYR